MQRLRTRKSVFRVCSLLLALLALYWCIDIGTRTLAPRSLQSLAVASPSQAESGLSVQSPWRRDNDGGQVPPGTADDASATDIHFSVKTTAKYHASRLLVLMLTWMQTVPDPHQVRIKKGCLTGFSTWAIWL